MKVGILTFFNAVNYGAVLQTYALQKFIEKKGFDVEVINYKNPSVKKNNDLNRNITLNKHIRYRLLKQVYLKARSLYFSKSWKLKYEVFEEFRKRNLNISKEDFNYGNYDAIFVGSDQVWNPMITNGFDPNYFCVKVPPQTIKVSYAASCGSLNVLNGCLNEFKDLTNNFDFISTREKDLSDFICDNIRKDVQHVLDPTLLLQNNDYEEIILETDLVEPYLLVYKMQNNTELDILAEKISLQKGLKMVVIEPAEFSNKKNDLGTVTPGHFIHLIKNASYVITNSFHGTAFSVIYEKNFITIPHKTVGTRMVSLLQTLNLPNQIIYSPQNLDVYSFEYEVDFSEARQILNNYRNVSSEFILTALKGKYTNE